MKPSHDVELNNCLIFWEDEDSFTIVESDKVTAATGTGDELGDECKVKMGSVEYKGLLVGKGTYEEMEELESLKIATNDPTAAHEKKNQKKCTTGQKRFKSDETNGNDKRRGRRIEESSSSSPVWKYFGYEKDDQGKPVNRNLPLCHISKDMLPVYSVEKEGFNRMLKALGPQYDLPSRKYFSQNAIPALYKTTRDRVSKKLKEIRYFSSTTDTGKKRDLVEAQDHLKLPYYSLVVDYVIRWGSTEKMVTRVLEQEAAIRQILSANRKCSHLVSTWQDLEVLESLKAALGSLADFTNILSGEEKVTLSTLNAVLHILKTQILSGSDSDTTLTADIKGKILRYLENKYSDSATYELSNTSSYVDGLIIY
uniref:Uncharacterized protein n=1 Tax=Amphimedon queenslandica TaxID=400682 RepID=A0A1X7TZ46_AMPQE